MMSRKLSGCRVNQQWRLLLALVMAPAFVPGEAMAAEQERSCEALRGLQLEHTEVVEARAVDAGFDISWKTLPIGVPGYRQPASCRVAAVSRPAPGSEIRFEVWMPEPASWNGRLYGFGNGGLAGSIDRLALALALQRGYAAVSTDTGHQADAFDGEWALGQPEKIRDYGNRAIHLMTVNAKALIGAYYGRPQDHAYFSSCSNGGRQALLEAQRHPEDYDGIVAGAPALDPAGMLATWGWMEQALTQPPEAYVPEKQLRHVTKAVMQACDTLDGVRDGVLENPRACRFDPAALRCAGGKHCFSAAQVEALRKIYQGPPGEYAGRPYHGFEPGGEEAGWVDFTGKKPGSSGHARFLRQYMRNLVLQDPSWDLERFDFAADRVRLEERLQDITGATDADLGRFASRGGKLILYHGWSDPAIQPAYTISYYEQLRAQTRLVAADNFVQLYMVPGAGHCFGGAGPGHFGQMRPGGDPAHSINAALEHWVEKGVKPGPIVATRHDSDARALLSSELPKATRSRPLCPYPQTARWDGKGNTDKADSFSCR